MNIRIVFTLGLLSVLWMHPLMAQKTSVYDSPDADYRMATELFNKGKYGAAQKIFFEVIEYLQHSDSKLKANAQYYAAICAVELFHPDAEMLLTSFIYQHPTHSFQSVASFQMGNLQYRKRNYGEALQWYARVDLYDLDSEQRVELQFKTGYSHFSNDNMAQAKQYFFDIRNPNSVYYGPATYYYGHIAYSEKNYETAHIYFQKLMDDDNFGPIVPYYITHIFFLQEKYDELLEYAPPLLEQASTQRAAEISRMIGEAWYNKGEFAKAIPFLEDYHSQTRQRISRQDHYQLAFAYYKAGEFDKAISGFERVTSTEDSLSQNALYHLADCYLQTDQRRSARNAFQQAHRMGFIEEISQNSLFNYAKLSFELSLNPFNEAIISFQRYIELYPESPRIEDAYRHLIDLYMTTSNYKDALSSLEAIPLNTPVLQSAYQRVAYFRGIQLFNNGDFEGAIEHFQKSVDHPQNRTIRAQALFWSGEAHFRLEQYPEAIQAHRSFMLAQGAFNLPEYNFANYSIGYSYFKMEDYPQAITAFRRFITDRNIDKTHRNDTYLRIADSYFITKDYHAAIDFYNRAIALQDRDADYATFQKAIAQGVTGRFDAKVITLKELLTKFPNTHYADDARYELANTFMIKDDHQKALMYYEQVINQHPNSGYAKGSMLKTGLIYYNTNQDDKALQVLRNVVEKFPGTPESREALVSIRNIYVSMDKVDEFVAFSQGLGFADITDSQQDSLTYIAAESRYMQGDCINATQSFSNYLERYPQGIFSLNAHFYKAECDYRLNDFQRALSGYLVVLERPLSQFSENAALRAAQINYKLAHYQAALEKFVLLEEIADFATNKTEAQIGQMRALDKLQRFEQSIEMADKVLQNDRIPQEITQEAYLIKARSHLGLNQLDQARTYYQKTNNIAENLRAAEAKYKLALIEFRKGNYQECEKLIFDFINPLAAYDQWLARIFILLADNYLVQDNTFQAKHTLQSIIENYDGDDIRNIALEKLKAIEQQEALEDAHKTPDTIEVEFNTNQEIF